MHAAWSTLNGIATHEPATSSSTLSLLGLSLHGYGVVTDASIVVPGVFAKDMFSAIMVMSAPPGGVVPGVAFVMVKLPELPEEEFVVSDITVLLPVRLTMTFVAVVTWKLDVTVLVPEGRVSAAGLTFMLLAEDENA